MAMVYTAARRRGWQRHLASRRGSRDAGRCIDLEHAGARSGARAHLLRGRQTCACTDGGLSTAAVSPNGMSAFSGLLVRSLAKYSPCCLATGAIPGSGAPEAPTQWDVSPTTNISGWPGTERSGFTFTLPTPSVSTPSQVPAGDAMTPAAQTTVAAAMRSVPNATPSGSQE